MVHSRLHSLIGLLRHLFTWSGRIGRGEYFLTMLGTICLVVLAIWPGFVQGGVMKATALPMSLKNCR